MSPASRSLADRRPAPLARVRGLGDLAAVLPYLLGFVPAESITCMGLGSRGRADRRVGLTARVDLAPVLDPDVGAALLDSVFTSLARTEARGALVLISTEASELDPAVVGRVQQAARRAGVDLFDVGWHRGDRCVSLLCRDPSCCPPEGVLVDTACQAAASATFAGAVVLPGRDAVEAEFARPAGVDPAALAGLIGEHETVTMRAVLGGDGAPHALAAAARVLGHARDRDEASAAGRPVSPLTDDEAAACLAALADIDIRDRVWLALDADEVHGQGLWLELAHRAPSPYDAAPLFLLGWRSWRHGDGVRTTIAAERANATPGGYSAAGLLLDAVGACVDPRSVPRLSA